MLTICSMMIVAATVAARHAPVIDVHLLEFDEIWAAAGSPNAVFRLTPTELVTMTGGYIMALHSDL